MTAPVPQQPDTLWVDLLVHWRPLQGLENPPEPYDQLIQASMVYRNNGLWTHHPDNPPGEIAHTIHEDTGATTTTVTLQAPTENYDDFPEATVHQPAPRRWKPYDSGTFPVTDPAQDPTQTTAEATFQKQSPAARVPEALAATPGVRGPWKTKIVERRPWGPRARNKALMKDRPTARQQQINSDYSTAAAFWSAMDPGDRQAWQDAHHFDRHHDSAFTLYLALVLGPPSDRKRNLERRIGRPLPTPQDP